MNLLSSCLTWGSRPLEPPDRLVVRTELLRAKSDEFAGHLTSLLRGCVIDAPGFGMVETGEAEQLHIGPLPFNTDSAGFSPIPLVRSFGANPRCR